MLSKISESEKIRQQLINSLEEKVKERTRELQKAKEAEQLKANEPSLTWAEIANLINWRYGCGRQGVDLLRIARKEAILLRECDNLQHFPAHHAR